MNESQNYLLMLASDFTKIYASTHENYVFTRVCFPQSRKFLYIYVKGFFSCWIMWFLKKNLNSTTEKPLSTEDSAPHYSVA